MNRFILDELDAMLEHERASRDRLLAATPQQSDLIYIQDGVIRGLALAKRLVEETE